MSFILPNHKIHIYIHTHSCTGTYIHYIYSYSCTQAHVCGHETTATPLGLSRLISWCGPISRQDAHPGADGVLQASGPLLPPWRLLKERLNLPCYLGLLCEPELESLFWFLSRKKKKFFFGSWCPHKETFVLIHQYKMLCRGYQSGKNNVIIHIVMLLTSCVVNTSK